jgi:hypothetical protein
MTNVFDHEEYMLYIHPQLHASLLLLSSFSFHKTGNMGRLEDNHLL